MKRAAIVVVLLLVLPTACRKKPEPYYSSCQEARMASAAPLHKGSPGYRNELDRDGDGVACDA